MENLSKNVDSRISDCETRVSKDNAKMHYVHAAASVKQNRSKIDVKQNGPKDGKQIDWKPNKKATQTFKFIFLTQNILN